MKRLVPLLVLSCSGRDDAARPQEALSLRRVDEEMQAPGYDVAAQAPSMVSLLDAVDPDFYPSAAALLARTRDLWAPYTPAEHLPTKADAETGMRDSEARLLFEKYTWHDAAATEMATQNPTTRSPAQAARLRTLRQWRDETGLALMRRLDRVTDFHRWEENARAHRNQPK
jgi:hypothetical protein